MEVTHKYIQDAVIKSQHCQRNWDLSKTIPKEDIELLIHAVTNCPSKQNIAYYDVYVISDRNIINEIHDNTDGFLKNVETNETTTNSQVLANLLFAFVPIKNEDLLTSESKHRNMQTDNLKSNSLSAGDLHTLERDRHTAIGIASGYLNLTASILGYATGCCACFTPEKLQSIIGSRNHVELLMGIGIKNENKNRRLHHKTDYEFPTKKKQDIKVIIK